MPKTKMGDVVIVLPGIMGSILHNKEGVCIWGSSLGVAGNVLLDKFRSAFGIPGESLQQLELKADDSEFDFAPDGVQPKGIMKFPYWAMPLHIILDDYQKLSETLTDYFDVVPGKNYFEFAYDWRRDNRINARRLERFVNHSLHNWRTDPKGNPEAKVILLGHSMGGLVARYYLEVLGGREYCKALFTFATPHRGSVESIESLANGTKFAGINLDAVVRSFPSNYQLLPIYPVIKIGDQYERIAEASIALPNIDKAKAVDALNFHHEIRDAVKQRSSGGYSTIPIVGTKQDTKQSAVLDENGKIQIGFDMPARLLSEGGEAVFGRGDGTVPYLSAIPIELTTEYRQTYIAERHGSVQNHGQVLDQVCTLMAAMQVRGAENFQNPGIDEVAKDSAAISLEVNDLYSAAEVVELRAKIIDSTADFGKLRAKITSASDESIPTQRVEFQEHSGQWISHLENLLPGLYRVEVNTENKGASAPGSVNGLFAVIA